MITQDDIDALSENKTEIVDKIGVQVENLAYEFNATYLQYLLMLMRKYGSIVTDDDITKIIAKGMIVWYEEHNK